MKKIITLYIVLLLGIVGYGQCPGPSTITFNTQAEVDAFPINYPNCTTLQTSIRLIGSDITDLTPFQQITGIASLFIDNTSLQNLNGLENVVEFPNPSLFEIIGIYNNPLLESVDALSNLEGTALSIAISNNPLLQSLNGLQNIFIQSPVEECGCSEITNNDSLVNLEGFTNGGLFGNITIEGNENLVSLDGLPPSDIDGANVGASPGFGIHIIDNPSLISLGDIELTFANNTTLEIANNPLLESLGTGTIDWPSCNELIQITNNPNLSLCSDSGLCEKLFLSCANPNNIDISNNAPGCSSIDELAEICFDCPINNLVFNTQQEIDDFLIEFPDCQHLLDGFDVTINGDDITDLTPLNQITSIRGTMRIINNPLLASLDGLGDITHIGGALDIRNNSSLTSLEALTNLTHIEELLRLNNNDALTSLEGLNNIAPNPSSEGIAIRISGNLLLTDITVLENIDPEIITALTLTNNIALSSCSISSFCAYLLENTNFTIGNNGVGCNDEFQLLSGCPFPVNIVSGNIQFDFDLDGCSSSDFDASSLIVTITDGNDSYSTLTNASGEYSRIIPNLGDFTVFIANPPQNFQANPETIDIVFNDTDEEVIVDFCLTASSVFNDLKITLIPTNGAPRPGFNSDYDLVYENVGTTTLSGEVTLQFDNIRQDFLNAIPSEVSISDNLITWSYEELVPFESRTISVDFNSFPPPTNDSDDLLLFEASITPISDDLHPDDNIYSLEQIFVNSQDPNDKLVNQGETITIEEVGDFLDYTVRFQNVGTASAINVRIEDELSSNLDWNSLRILSASHEYRLEIINGQQLIFYFDDIHLPSEDTDPEGSNGHISFQIRSLETLELGDSIENEANIFFDFNAPILTNTVVTEVAIPLGMKDLNANVIVSASPNPVSEKLQIDISGTLLHSISVYSILGNMLLETSEKEIDFSGLSNGIYLVKINTDLGSIVKKIIKE